MPMPMPSMGRWRARVGGGGAPGELCRRFRAWKPIRCSGCSGAAWRESTDADAPTLLQVMHEGVVRVDVDAVAGYLAVVADGETHRAIGLRRDLVAALVCVLSGRPMDDERRRLTKGPAKIETAHDDEAAGE